MLSSPPIKPPQNITLNVSGRDARKVADSLRRHHLPTFIRACFSTLNPTTEYLHNWHIDAIADRLEACRAGQIRRLIINMPPRMMKSLSVTVAYPAFLLGHAPGERIICASYASDLSTSLSLQSRTIIKSDWYQRIFPGTRLRRDEDRKTRYLTTKQGLRYAVTVGGQVTGEGGNTLIVDDPMRPDEAMSKLSREKTNIWYDSVFGSRHNDKKKGCTIVIMQRLHEKDLCGHIETLEPWEKLVLPGENDGPSRTYHFFGMQHEYKSGEYLHPAREGKEEFDVAKLRLGAYGFSAQYQQKPTPVGGGVIKLGWFKRYDVRPAKFLKVIQSWDTAIKAGVGNDWSVCITWGETESGYYIIDVVRERLEYPDLKRRVQSAAMKHAPDVILIEDKGSGQSLLQDLRRDTKLPVIAIMPEGDKGLRVERCSPTIEAGVCYLPNPGPDTPWLHDLETEVSGFPNTEYMDQVDALSQYLNWAKSSRRTYNPRVL